MLKKRLGTAVLAATAASLLVAGVGAVPAHAAGQTITIWADDQRGPALATFLDNNSTVAAGYTISVKTFAGRDAMISAWDKSSATGGPDILFDEIGSAVTAAKNGKALPIVLTAQNKKELSSTGVLAGQYQGVQYGVPLDVDTTTMYWNTKFGKAPKTLREFVTRYNAAKKAGKATVGLCAGDGTWGALPLLTALGGGAWGYKADGVTPDINKVLFNSKDMVNNTKTLLLSKSGKSTGFFKWDGWDGCGQTWLNGGAMAINTGAWRMSATIDAGLNYTLQPVPTIDGKGKSHQWTGFGGAFGTSFSKDHGVDLGVKQVMAYLASAKGSLAYATATKRPGANSATLAHVSADTAGFAFAGSNNGIVQENALLGDNTGGSNWYDVLSSTFDAIFNKGADAKKTLDKAAAILKADWADGFAKR